MDHSVIGDFSPSTVGMADREKYITRLLFNGAVSDTP